MARNTRDRLLLYGLDTAATFAVLSLFFLFGSLVTIGADGIGAGIYSLVTETPLPDHLSDTPILRDAFLCGVVSAVTAGILFRALGRKSFL